MLMHHRLNPITEDNMLSLNRAVLFCGHHKGLRDRCSLVDSEKDLRSGGDHIHSPGITISIDIYICLDKGVP